MPRASTALRFLLPAILLLGAAQALAQALLSPPFGLRWGDSPEKLISWAAKHSLDVNISLPADQPGLRILKVESRAGTLPDSKAAGLEGRFLGGKLYEVAVHHLDRDKAGAEAMTARFESERRQLAVEHGPLLANQQQRSVEDQFVTRTQSFHREPVKGLFLLLAFTEVEDLLRKSRDARYSLIYRNDNYRKELQEEMAGR
jgi:hypothetical protein